MTEPIEIQLPNKPYNLEALDAALRAALGKICFGVSTRQKIVYVLLDPTATTDQQVQAVNIADTHNPATPSPAQSTLTALKSSAQSAVGVALADLTASQRNALMVALLWKVGGINPDGTIRPLGDWLA